MAELRKVEDARVQSYLRLIDGLDVEIRSASKKIEQRAKDNEDAKLLMTIPGISFFSALLVISEVGEISRFEDSSSLVAYAGLAPSTHSSGGKTYHGPIMKSGSRYLRWAMGQCARAHMRIGARRDGRGVLRQDQEEEGRPEGDSGRVREDAQDSLLGPQGEEGVSQLRGMAAVINVRARASKN